MKKGGRILPDSVDDGIFYSDEKRKPNKTTYKTNLPKYTQMEWIKSSDQLPELEFKVDGQMVSKRVLIYREPTDDYDVGWLIRTPAGRRAWKTRTDSTFMIYDIDCWHALPERPKE